MNAALHIEKAVPAEVEKALDEELSRFNAQVSAPVYEEKRYALKIEDEKGKLQAALLGDFFWEWMHLVYLWVDESKRGQGLGQRLLKEAEEEATRRNAVGIYLWTQNWQAPDFYEKLGYERFATLNDFPPGYQRIGMMKKLSGHGA